MERDGNGGTRHRGLEKAHIQKGGCILSAQVTLQRGYLRADCILFTTTTSRVSHSARSYLSLNDYIKLKGAKIKMERRDPKETEQCLGTCLLCKERKNLKDKVFSGIISYIKMKKKKKMMRTGRKLLDLGIHSAEQKGRTSSAEPSGQSPCCSQLTRNQQFQREEKQCI